MGAVVSVPARSVPVGVSKYLIIDGQQRLTTISILLCALRDCIDPNTANRIQEVYLTNRFRDSDDVLKLVPTQQDRETYNAIVLEKRNPATNNLLSKAYEFFARKLRNGKDGNDVAIESAKVLTVLEQNLQVVMINLSNTDDPHLIFESLNFKGSPLTQADLVRNYLLMRFRHSVTMGGEQERIYQTYWSPLEKLLGDKLTDFLRYYAMKSGDNVRMTEMYTAIKKKLKDFDNPSQVEDEMKHILNFGYLYARIIQPNRESCREIQLCLENIKTLEISTSHPLLLRLFDVYESNKMDESEFQKCLALIESFVIRRAVCAVPTNALNKIFLQWTKNFPSENYYEWLLDFMSSGSGGQQFPDDEQFGDAFKNKLQYGRGATGFILKRLEKSFSHKETVDLTSCTIEHVLPQTLTNEWIECLGGDAEEIHRKIGDTFGNLTLTAYNSELSNNSFSDKKDRLKNSHIELNRLICEQEKWGVEEIKQRADTLFSIAKSIWTAPSTVKHGDTD